LAVEAPKTVKHPPLFEKKTGRSERVPDTLTVPIMCVLCKTMIATYPPLLAMV